MLLEIKLAIKSLKCNAILYMLRTVVTRPSVQQRSLRSAATYDSHYMFSSELPNKLESIRMHCHCNASAFYLIDTILQLSHIVRLCLHCSCYLICHHIIGSPRILAKYVHCLRASVKCAIAPRLICGVPASLFLCLYSLTARATTSK